MLHGKVSWSALAIVLLVAGGTPEAVASQANAKWVIDAAKRKKEFIRLPGKSERALKDASAWLLAHQDEDGRWNSSGFMKHCPDKSPCQGAGLAHDVGVTGLALLALMASTDMIAPAEARFAVERGLRWLVKQQGSKGLIGAQIGSSFLYDHAIATTALAEGLLVLELEELRAPLERAVACIGLARNPEGVWRYDLPPTGDNDTSVSAWMVGALATARDAGIAVPEDGFRAAITWVDAQMDRETGRIGYDSPGSASARVPGVNDHYPTDKNEAMTAAGMWMRYLCGQDAKREPFIEMHTNLILKALPAWGERGLTADLYAWYYCASALHQRGDKPWRVWSNALEEALTAEQERRGPAKGSWAPAGPWGFAGGRVYATAIAALTLAAPVRHRRLADD